MSHFFHRSARAREKTSLAAAAMMLAASGAAQAAPAAAPVARGRIGQALRVGAAEITISGLRLMEGNVNLGPPAGCHFIAFTLKVRSAGAGRVSRAGWILESLRGARGESVEAPFTINSIAGQTLAPPDNEAQIIPAGGEHEFTLVRAIKNSTQAASWRAVLITDVNGARQRARDYAISLGPLPRYTPPPLTRVAMNVWGRRDGAMVRVLKAAVAEGSGPNARVKVQVRLGNPLEVPITINQVNSVTLEDSSGHIYPPDVLGGIMQAQAPEAERLPGIELEPQKQVDGWVFFNVPRSRLGSLRARFNPATGQGFTIVPLGSLR